MEGINNKQRKHVQDAIERINHVKRELGCLMEDIQGISDEEENYRDNTPENLQGSDQYEAAEHACVELEAACEAFGESISDLESVVASLKSAIE